MGVGKTGLNPLVGAGDGCSGLGGFEAGSNLVEMERGGERKGSFINI